MPSTRWGDNLDIITTEVQSTALKQYKVIVMLGDVHLDARLRSDLTAWVERGGALVMNSAQMTGDDAAMAGVAVTSTTQRTASMSRWLPETESQSESSYLYTAVQPMTAEVLAVNESAAPLLTRRRLGKGEVI